MFITLKSFMRSSPRITRLEFGSQLNPSHHLCTHEAELTFCVAGLNIVPWKDSSMPSAPLISLRLAAIFHVPLPSWAML